MRLEQGNVYLRMPLKPAASEYSTSLTTFIGLDLAVSALRYYREVHLSLLAKTRSLRCFSFYRAFRPLL